MQSKAGTVRNKTTKDVFAWYWNFTSLAGFTQCRDTDTLISKAFWFILAITGWALTSYSTLMTIKSFLEYETVTKTNLTTGTVFKTKLHFPSVTICNSNRVHCGHLYDLILKCEQVAIFHDYDLASRAQIPLFETF